MRGDYKELPLNLEYYEEGTKLHLVVHTSNGPISLRDVSDSTCLYGWWNIPYSYAGGSAVAVIDDDKVQWFTLIVEEVKDEQSADA